MRRFSGRFRSALVIGVQGIRARKTRTLLSMISLFLGVLAVVTVQAGASIAERATLADLELVAGRDGTRTADVMQHPKAADIVLGTVRGRTDATARVYLQAIIGEPGVRPVNEGGSPIGENWGGGSVCYADGRCEPPAQGAPPGQAVEVRLIAMTGDGREFRPVRQQSGRWLDFASLPALAPRLVLNKEAAKGFEQYRVPAEMRVAGASANMTPRFVGVVDDGEREPHAYVRFDELSTWLPPALVSGPDFPGTFQVQTTGGSPVEQVLSKKLQAAGVEAYWNTVNSRKEQEAQLRLFRLIFLAMAGLVLLIGVAGILNVGLATVGERVEEFALRRAVGTPRALLAGIVLAETLLTGLLTAAAAIGAGAAGLKVLSMLFADDQPFLRDVQIPWDAGLAGVIAGLIAGVLGGFVPAVRAAGIPIATVMRA